MKSPRYATSALILLFSLCFAILGVVLAPSAGAATAAPAWRLVQRSLPTYFEPGSSAPAGGPAQTAAPMYAITVENIGAAPSEGLITVTDVLPPAVLPASAHDAEIGTAHGAGSFEPCAPATGQRVECTWSASVEPGGLLVVLVPVDIPTSSSGLVENQVSVAGGLAGGAASRVQTQIRPTAADFGFLEGPQGLSAIATEESGAPDITAGSHPYQVSLEVNLATRLLQSASRNHSLVPSGSLRDLEFELPQGMVIDPNATPRCTAAQLLSEVHGEGCPPDSQVGQVFFSQSVSGFGFFSVPLYNMVPAPGQPAEFAFSVLGIPVRIAGGLNGGYHLTSAAHDILAKLLVTGVDARLWGVPSAADHDSLREGAGCNELTPGFEFRCPVTRTEEPLVTMPSACSPSLSIGASISSWDDPEGGEPRAELRPMSGPAGEPAPIEGCEALAFHPRMLIRSTSQSTETPTGLEVEIQMPQNQGASGRATGTLKRVVVELPEGMTINPPAADGLGACSASAIGIGDDSPAQCAKSSRIGSVEISTPLLNSTLMGAVYLAEQKSNPFGTLIALYVVAEGEGIVLKLPGRVDLNQSTGRITATFDNNPELPFSDFKLSFSSGPRATLSTSRVCGNHVASSELVSWAAESTVTVSSLIPVTAGCADGGFSPKFEAGTANPVGGSFAPFILRIQREDGEQNLSRISATLPKGLLAKLSGVPVCPEDQAATNTCPSESRIGSTVIGVGSGSHPLYIPQAGKSPTAVYLAGPYKGAPYSLVVTVPAQAGPFDLGSVAVRAALSVDPFTAQVTATSDPLPQILEGIPIAYRDVRVIASRPEFVVNPTNCEPMNVGSMLTSAAGDTAYPQVPFQVAGCEALTFRPSLKISVKGSTRRTGHPALKAVVTYPKQGSFANISRAQVTLPRSEFLDQGNLNKACTKPLLLTGMCPKSSIYGKAKAWTPLLDDPLEGSVYLVGGFGYKLPALVAELNGQIRVLLKGKVDSGPNGGIRNTFEAVPDAAISRFVLQMRGGRRYSLLENSEDLCKKPQFGQARFTAQNGRVEVLRPKIGNSCQGRRKSHSRA